MKLTGLTPNLVCADIDRSLAFYRDVLGFTVTTTVPDQAPYVFVWLQRDEVNVFLNEVEAVRKEMPDAQAVAVGKSGVMLFIHMEGVEALWNQVKQNAAIIMPLKDQWYGMTEFSVVDPDEYVITFGERRSRDN